MQNLAVALQNSERLFDENEIDAAIRRVAADVRNDYAGPRPVYLSVMHGGMLFASRLSLAVGIDLEFDYLHATRYRGATTGSGLAWLHRPATPLEGRRVLIADDILDEGHTLSAIIDYLKSEGARDVQSAVLVHKLHDRKAYPGMRADFTGLDVADRFLFGCGMDYKGYWRNAAGIYALKGH